MIRTKNINFKKVLYFCILIVCLGVSIYQLLGCIGKLRHPPITTHYRFGLNETLNYPAVTVCRNPPYKMDVLKKYNLGEMNSGMEETSQWEKFPFKSASIQKVWDEATYKLNEVLPMFGLHGIPENVEVVSSYHYLKGQCFTLIPKTGEELPGPSSGWSLILKHDQKRFQRLINKNISLVKTYKKSSFDSGAGFNIFIHQVREPYYENQRQTSSMMEHIYLEVGEELEIKLIAEQFNQISTSNNPCETDINYSASKCAEMKRWMDISKDVACIGPWMNGIYLPQCWNYKQFKKLLQRYLKFEDSFNSCNRSCNLTAYKLFVVNRVPSEIPSYSALFIYYTSKHFTVMEEKLGYDWNFFLSDIGGSLGFFLGISVVGVVGIIENFLGFICGSKRKDEKQDGDNPPEYSENDDKEKKIVV